MDPPEELTQEGRANWDKVLPDLIESRVYRPSDELLLVEFCEALAMAQRFRRKFNKLPDEEIGGAEAKRLRTGYREMYQTAASIAGEYGMSPVTRTRLGLMTVQGQSLVEKLRAGMPPEGEDGDFE